MDNIEIDTINMDNLLQYLIRNVEYSVVASDINESFCELIIPEITSVYQKTNRIVFENASNALKAFSDKLSNLIKNKNDGNEKAELFWTYNLIPALKRIKVQYEFSKEYNKEKIKVKNLIFEYLNSLKVVIPNSNSAKQLYDDIKYIKNYINAKFNRKNDRRHFHINVLIRKIKETLLSKDEINKIIKLGKDILKCNPNNIAANNLVNCCKRLHDRHNKCCYEIRSFSKRLRDEFKLEEVTHCNNNADETIKCENSYLLDLKFVTDILNKNTDIEASTILYRYPISNASISNWTKMCIIKRIFELCKLETSIRLTANKLYPYYREVCEDFYKTPTDMSVFIYIDKIAENYFDNAI